MRLIPKQGQPIEIAEDEESTILGRQPHRGHAVKHATVSREHARLFQRDGNWRVADLNSSNGTFVNGKKVSTSPIHDGDTLRIGEVDFSVEFGAARSGDASPAEGVDLELDIGASGGDDDEIVLEDPAAELDQRRPSIDAMPDQTIVAPPSPMFKNRPTAAPQQSNLSERSQALLRAQSPKSRGGDGTLLAQDVGQYSGARQILMIVAAVAVAVGLFFGVLKLTERVVPAGAGIESPSEDLELDDE